MNIRDTWPCADCGHKHDASQECPDHWHTPYCPSDGVQCPTDAVARCMDDLIPPPTD